MVLVVGLCGCATEHGAYLRQHVGTFLTIELKRDALGASSNVPVSPCTDTMNGGKVSLTGRLIQVERGAIVLQAVEGKPTYWIPEDAILMVVEGKAGLSEQSDPKYLNR